MERELQYKKTVRSAKPSVGSNQLHLSLSLSLYIYTHLFPLLLLIAYTFRVKITNQSGAPKFQRSKTFTEYLLLSTLKAQINQEVFAIYTIH